MIQAGQRCRSGADGQNRRDLGGTMYSEYHDEGQPMLPMNEGVTAKEGASCFVNPLTALGMVETCVRRATPYACPYGSRFEPWPDVGKDLPKDNVPLVNIVEKMSTWSC